MSLCEHPPERQRYIQLNVESARGITIADVLGGINPYVWRIEYCGECWLVFKTFGEVPNEELANLWKHRVRYLVRKTQESREKQREQS